MRASDLVWKRTNPHLTKYLKGECHVFALALSTRFPSGTFVALGTEHFGLRVGDRILDARGSHTPAEFAAPFGLSADDIREVTREEVQKECGYADRDEDYFDEVLADMAGVGVSGLTESALLERAQRVDVGPHEVVVHRDIRPKSILHLLNNSKWDMLRGLVDGDTIFWWDAGEAIHAQVANAMGMEPVTTDDDPRAILLARQKGKPYLLAHKDQHRHAKLRDLMPVVVTAD